MTDELLRNLLLGLAFFVVGVSVYMCWRHVKQLWKLRHRWDLWFLLIYAGIANTVGLIAEALWAIPGVPLTWRAFSFGVGLSFIAVGSLGVAWSVGSHDKRATDRREP